MLYIYSSRALSQNWLNSTVVQILAVGMRSILGEQQVTEWPDIIPEDRRQNLRGRSGIQTRLTTFWAEYHALERQDQEAMLEALEQQTSLPDVLFNDEGCIGIDVFPDRARSAAVDLFRFLFEKQLTTLKVGEKCLRDIHYGVIYDETCSHICPFCGIGYFRAPGAPRNALDHYMPISKYPFVGADLRNLPPMCSECNSDFKGNKDILFDDCGRRRRCVDPYNGPVFSISLAESLPFAGSIKDAIHLPRWEITFVGGPPEQAENWDRVFNIRERYKRDILDAEFRSWLEHFAFWYLASHAAENIEADIAASIPEYIETVIQDRLADRAFLKAEAFRLLQQECADPNRGDDMKLFLKDLVAYI